MRFLPLLFLLNLAGLTWAEADPDEGRLVAKSDFFDGRTDWQGAGMVTSWTREGASWTLNLAGGPGASVRLTFASPEAVRVLWDPQGRDAGQPSFAVTNPALAPVDPRLTEGADTLVFDTGSLRLEVDRRAFGLKLYRGQTLLASTLRSPALSGRRTSSVWALTAADRIYGLGEKAGPLKKNGQSVKNWNTDAYGWSKGTDPLYVSVPFFVSARDDGAWGLFLDNPRQTFFNLGRDRAGEIRVGASDGAHDLWLFTGAGTADVVKAFSSLTGKIPLPPAWSLGYHQSKYSYMTADEVVDVAQTFVKKKLPAQVIYLDIDYMERYRSFTVDPNAFPDLKATVDRLHGLGFRVIAIVDPGIAEEQGYSVYDSGTALGAWLKDSRGRDLTGKVWPGVCVFPDFSRADVRTWWGGLYAGLAAAGIDGFWNDMNEPAVFDGPGKTLSLDAPLDRLHNVYGHLMVQATRAGLEALRPGQRPFVLSRAGYAGTQRYAAHWTGDNTANWDHLKLNLTMVLNLGLSGYPLTGADVGGYAGNPSPELLVRWMQLGALMPYFRNHTEKGHDGHEPWQFGDEAEDLSRRALDLRAGLAPYLYDLVRQASAEGSPLVRPLFWDFGADPASYSVDDEFLVGEALLAAPVVTSRASTRTVVLPAGTDWYDWWTGKKYPGGQTLTLAVDLGSVPLFARAGTIVPWQGKDGLEFRVFPGTGPAHQAYFDDGATTAYQGGAFTLTQVAAPASAAEAPRWTTLAEGWAPAPRTATAVYPDGRRVAVLR